MSPLHAHRGADPVGPVKDGEVARFTFSRDLSTVVSMTLDHGAYTHAVDIGGDHFDLTLGTRADGSRGVVAVERTQTVAQLVHTAVYTDADGDGRFQVAFDIGVLTGGGGRWIGTHDFSFAADGRVTADVETRGGHRHAGSAGGDVEYQTGTLDGEAYVVKTVQLSNDDVCFEVTRDDDGTWTTIASGHVDATAAATYLDDGSLDLSGVQDYLQPPAAGQPNRPCRNQFTRAVSSPPGRRRRKTQTSERSSACAMK